MLELSASEIESMRDTHTAHMGFTCRITRGTSDGVDDYGQPTGLTWATYYEGRCDFAEQREVEVSGTIAVVVTTVKVLLPESAIGVAPGDHVAWVKNHEGVSVAEDLDIREVLLRIDGVDVITEESE